MIGFMDEETKQNRIEFDKALSGLDMQRLLQIAEECTSEADIATFLIETLDADTLRVAIEEVQEYGVGRHL